MECRVRHGDGGSGGGKGDNGGATPRRLNGAPKRRGSTVSRRTRRRASHRTRSVESKFCVWCEHSSFGTETQNPSPPQSQHRTDGAPHCVHTPSPHIFYKRVRSRIDPRHARPRVCMYLTSQSMWCTAPLGLACEACAHFLSHSLHVNKAAAPYSRSYMVDVVKVWALTSGSCASP